MKSFREVTVRCLSRDSRRLIVTVAITFAIVVGSFTGVNGTTLDEPDAGDIVWKADQIRFPPYGFQVDVTVTTMAPGREPDVRKYRILSKGNDRTLVLTTAPPVDRGQIMLMRDQELWVFLPSVSQPVRLPLSQRLTGQVANGDLARANFAGDYSAKILRTETIEGQNYYVLNLTATRRGVTYDRVVYWVNKVNYRPYKAEFYARSGRLLKRAFYQQFVQLGDGIRPARIVLEDMLRKGERSIMSYTNMRQRELSDKVFTKYYLKKLQ